MRKPAFCIFCGLCILTLFSLLTVDVRGVSNKHCLLPFFHFQSVIASGLLNNISDRAGYVPSLSTSISFSVCDWEGTSQQYL